MKDYRKELDKVGEMVTKVQEKLEGKLNEKLSFEYSSDYIAFKIYGADKCSYSRMQVQYSKELNREEDVDIYAGALLLKYYNKDFTEYVATEEEIFINSLIQKYECESFYVDGGELHYDNIAFPLNDITKIAYYKTIDSIRLDTDLEYCIIELDADVVTCVDKDEVAE